MYLASGTGGFQKLCFKTPLYRDPFKTPVGYDLKNLISTLCPETYVKDWISKAEYFLPFFQYLFKIIFYPCKRVGPSLVI